MLKTDRTPNPAVARMGLPKRIFCLLFAPAAVYAALAVRPRVVGALAVALTAMVVGQFIFLSTDVGQVAALQQQISTMKGFGIGVTDAMITQLRARQGLAPYLAAASLIVFRPLMLAVLAGMLMGLFNVLFGRDASYEQTFAVVAHNHIIIAIQQVFGFILMYARGEMGNPTRIVVFFPMLNEKEFLYSLLSSIDPFHLWATVNLSIGIAVLYKRSIPPTAAGFLIAYFGLMLLIALVRFT